MAIERWDPFREMMTLREAMDRLLQESFVRPTRALPVDVAETDNEYVVKASVPGITPNDVQINAHSYVVTIQVESKAEAEGPGQNWLLRERPVGQAQRSITLPMAIDPNKAVARYEHGVLTLTLPKAEEARPKEIKIQT